MADSKFTNFKISEDVEEAVLIMYISAKTLKNTKKSVF